MDSGNDPLDLAKVLVRTVVRAFYETEHVIVLDALVKHSALSAADVSIAMHLSPSNSNKTVQRLVARLREGGLVSIFTRQEIRDGATKPLARDYYFIDYRRAIDSTKYRLHMLSDKIKAESSSTAKEEKKELYCTQCSSQFTLMEVLDMKDPQGRGAGFLCRRCGHFLLEIDEDMVEKDDTTARFNNQFKTIVTLCSQIDQVTVPETTGEQALANSRPMPRTELNPTPKTQPALPVAARPTAVKGQATGPEKIEVAITSESENSAAQRIAEAERRAKIAAQNQLPEWHVRSTVSGEVVKNRPHEHSYGAAAPVAVNGDEKDKKTSNDTDELDKVFEQLEREKAEKERLQQAEDEEEDEDDDDDDDEFEDIAIVGANGANGTPSFKIEDASGSLAGSAVGTPAASSDARPSSLVVKAEPTMPIDTPKESDADDDEFEDVPPASSINASSDSLAGTKRSFEETNGESPTKKIKSETTQGDSVAQINIAVQAAKAGEESDEDDEEFENVI